MMKKVLLGLAALSCVSLAAEGTNVYLKAGADILQRFDETKYNTLKLNKEKGDDFGYELTVEVMREVYSNLELGFGLSYQDHGDPKTSSNNFSEKYEMSGYKSVPIYITAKYNIPVKGNIKPYLKADLGYSFNDERGNFKVIKTASSKASEPGYSRELLTKVENGLYYGIGAGAEYNNFVVDLMYKVNKAEMKADVLGERVKKDLDYSRVTLSVGYKFNF